MTNFGGRLLWMTVLATMSIRPVGGGELQGSAAALPEVMARHRLVLVYRAGDLELTRAIAPFLNDLATVYATDGLGVAVAGLTADAIVRLGGAAWWRLAEAERGDSGPSLALYRHDGEALAAMTAPDMDLYVIYRACERHLRGQDRTTFYEHVTQVLTGQIQRRAAALAIADPGDIGGPCDPVDDRDGSVAIEDLLAAHPDGCLLLPPGCTECLLAKHAAALGELFAARPVFPVLAFAPVAVGELRRHGWLGSAYQLPEDAEARLLALRQAGHYVPVIVAKTGSRSLSVRPLRTEGRS